MGGAEEGGWGNRRAGSMSGTQPPMLPTSFPRVIYTCNTIRMSWRQIKKHQMNFSFQKADELEPILRFDIHV